MTPSQHKRADELQELISTTSVGLASMKELQQQAARNPAVAGARIGLHDQLYNFHIAEYCDGSGQSSDLARYEGNDELLEAIIVVLTRQLAAFQAEYNAI
jgi:hypothetical protein